MFGAVRTLKGITVDTPPADLIAKHQLVIDTPVLKLYKLTDARHGWRIYAVECRDPQLIAMLQALYSRSPMGIEERLGELFRVGKLTRNQLRDEGISQEYAAKIKKFMAQYYVAYGHRSIADCGTFTLFVEGVPMHLLTQIQDSHAFDGQEASSRFMEWAAKDIWDPIGSKRSAAIQRRWMDFYVRGMKIQQEYLRTQNPLAPGEDPKLHASAIFAGACDVMRGFIPVGAPTMGSWSVNLRQLSDHGRMLRRHPDALVRDMGHDFLTLAQALYPDSFQREERAATNDWLRDEALPAVVRMARGSTSGLKVRVTVPSRRRFVEAARALARRPRRADINKHLSDIAYVHVRGRMDFGSFRDAHRHRALRLSVGLIGTGRSFDFEDWYVANLAPELQPEARKLIAQQQRAVALLECDPFERQLYMPLGALMAFDGRSDLGGWIYFCELRSLSYTHHTVRLKAWGIAEGIRAGLAAKSLPAVRMTIDHRPSRFNLERGSQTIRDTATGQTMAGH